MTNSAEDARFMALALALGRRGLGRTWPNPAVGAVRATAAPGPSAAFARRGGGGRPHFTLILAFAAGGGGGRAGRGRVPTPGAPATARVHRMRAMSDAIMIGIGTALADDPSLTC